MDNKLSKSYLMIIFLFFVYLQFTILTIKDTLATHELAYKNRIKIGKQKY